MDGNARVANAYGVWSHPTTFIINREGKIIARAIGGRDWASQEMVNLFLYLLKEKES